MNKKKCAVSELLSGMPDLPFETVSLSECDFTAVSVCLVAPADTGNGQLARIRQQGFGQPVFMVLSGGDAEALPDGISGVIDLCRDDSRTVGDTLLRAAQSCEESLLPPFFGRMKHYTAQQNISFACPGHQGGEFFRRHPAGQQFTDYFGDALFRADLCNADTALGDLLIHEGAALAAQQHAAKVFHADKTWFVLNGTSSSNKVVLNALLTPGDLVLFDRNNHKSNHHGALIQAGATPVYLEAARNPFGFIGGIDAHCFD
ncbi:TPA: ornithine decarboxylase, partial [Klebsiella pneumoniae]|nr:ornithine decarboxylase [Klebsiella pneumoniae]